MCYNGEEDWTFFKPCLSTLCIFPAIFFKIQCTQSTAFSSEKQIPPMWGLSVAHRQIKAKHSETDLLWGHLWQQKLIACYYEKVDIYKGITTWYFSVFQPMVTTQRWQIAKKEITKKKNILYCYVMRSMGMQLHM